MANVIQFTIKGSTTSAVKSMEKMKASLAKIAKVSAVVGTALLAAFSYSLKSIVDVGSKVENLKIRLNALLGSTQEGSKAFKQMAEFASQVPFAYDDIMESATTLAGVVTGGADEISQWMPIIADLATVSGLSIQDATSQVQRMLSAGAGAADLFRERGITAMLGFQSGVAVSVEETKKKLIEAFEDPASKFRGASKKMATTWDGALSMIGDKWFSFKSAIAESGVFNYIKSIAIVFDTELGKAINDGGVTAKSFSDNMIAGLRGILVAVGFVADSFYGLKVVWKGLEVLFSMFATGMYETLTVIANGVRNVANMLPLVNVKPFETLNATLISARGRTSKLKEELQNLITDGMPSDKIEEFSAKVEAVFNKLNTKVVETVSNIKQVVAATSEVTDLMIEDMRVSIEEKFLLLNESILTERETEVMAYNQKILDLQNFYMTSEMTDAKHNKLKEKLNEAHLKNMASKNKLAIKGSFDFGQAIRKREVVGIISSGADMINASRATNKTAFRIQKAASLAKAIATLPSAVIQSYDNGGGYPWGLIPAGLMAVAGASEIGKIAGTSYSGAAHGGLTNVPKESTYLLQKGERVLSPNQNKDFTSMVRNGGGSSGGGSGGVTIGNVVVHILENATNADAILDMDRSQMEELVAGPIIDALDSLDSQGIKPNFARRSDA